jgi:hypothetical protein
MREYQTRIRLATDDPLADEEDFGDVDDEWEDEIEESEDEDDDSWLEDEDEDEDEEDEDLE